MSNNENENKTKESEISLKENETEAKLVKSNFGSLTPLTAAQIVTLLIGTGMSNNSSGGGY